MKDRRWNGWSPAFLTALFLVLLGWASLRFASPVAVGAAPGAPTAEMDEAGARAVLTPAPSPSQRPPDPAPARTRYGDLPLTFEPNVGQGDPEDRFLSRGATFAMEVRAGGAPVRFGPGGSLASEASRSSGAGSRGLPSLRLIGADPAAGIEALDELPGRVHYLIGSDPALWRTNIPTYARIRYRDVYPGVDLFLQGSRRELVAEFVVSPGGDPAALRFRLEDAGSATMDADGGILWSDANGALLQHRPTAWQDGEGGRTEVRASFVLAESGEVALSVGERDGSRSLMIRVDITCAPHGGAHDPVEDVVAIAADAAGHAFLTARVPAAKAGGGSDVLVTRLDPEGRVALSTTYLGGSGADEPGGIAVDSAGRIHVAGTTRSIDFPTVRPIQGTAGGLSDAFVAALSPDGSALLFSTYLGGEGEDRAGAVAADPLGAAYVAGTTRSTSFPTARPLQAALRGKTDAFISKIAPDGSSLLYSTYVGGEDEDSASGVVVDGAGEVTVVGHTSSASFPTASPLQPALAGGADAFVAKLGADGGTLIYSTYFGGEGDDQARGVSLDAAGAAWVAGTTRSKSLPTVGSFQPAIGGEADAFVAKLGPDGSSLLYGTYLGGEGDDGARAIVVDARGDIWVAGETRSAGFPSKNPAQPTLGGEGDAFLADLSAESGALRLATFLGGSGNDAAFGVAADGSGHAYVAGLATSADSPFTTPVHPVAGGSDAFVGRLSDPSAPSEPLGACPGTKQFDNGAGTGLWQTAINWSGDTLPTSSDDVCIDGSAVTLSSGSQNAGTLRVQGAGGSLTLSGGTLTIAGTSEITTPFDMNGGTLTGAGAVTISGLFTWSSGTISGGPGVVTANGGILFDSTTATLSGRTLDHTSASPGATVASGTGGYLTMANGATFNNQTGALFEVQNDQGVFSGGGAGSTFNNAGTFRRTTSAGAANISSVTFNNTGSLEVQTGSMLLTGGGSCGSTCGGAFKVSTGALIQFNSGTYSISGPMGGPTAAEGGGKLDFSGAKVNLTGTYQISGETSISAEMVNFSAAGTTTIDTLRMTGGTLSGASAINVTGLFTWSNGTVTGGPAAFTASGGILFDSTTTTLSGRIMNHTSASPGATLRSGTVGYLSMVNGATFNNQAGALFEVQNDQGVFNGGGTTSTFNNAGTFRRTTSSGQADISSITFNNTGTVEVLTGSLNLSGTYQQTAGVTRLNGGGVSASIPIPISGGILEGFGTITGDVSVTGTGVFAPGLSPGILEISGDYTQGTTGSFSVELGGLTPGTQHDQLQVTGFGGSATLNGTLNVSQIGGFTPVLNDTFVIITCVSHSGIFTTTNFPPTPSGLQWVVDYGAPTEVRITLVPMASADLSLTKSDSPDPVFVGGTLKYDLDISNAGPDTATNVVVTDTLDPNVTFVSVTPTGTGWTCGEAGGVVTCTYASLEIGAAPRIQIFVTPTAAGVPSVSNTATVASAESDPASGNNTATTSTAVNPVSDLSISKSDSPDPVAASGTLTYTVDVSNAGLNDATSVGMTDTLPAGVTFLSATGTGWTCGQAGGVVTCTRPTLAVGAAPSITITVTAPGTPGTITNAASVTATEFDPTTPNMDTEVTSVTAVADLSITKTDSPDPVNAAATLTYTLSASNAGPSTANSLTVTDTLPAGVTFVSASGTGWTCGQAGGVVTCTRPSLAVGAAPVITITVTASNEGGTIVNDATLTATEFDPTSPNAASASTTVTSISDLSIAKSDSPDPVDPTATLTYTLAVANTGPSTATSLVATDTLPAGVTFVSASGTGWTCSEAGGTVTCTRPSLAVGAAPAITITVTAPGSGGTLDDTAAVSSAMTDPSLANNSASETTTVRPAADLSVLKADSPDPVNAGATLTYTLDVTNAGPDAASSLTVTDTLPAGVVFVSASGTGWTCNQAGGVVTCTRAFLAAGAAPTITITVTAPAQGGSISNGATVAASGSVDLVAGNNSDTEGTTVTPVADLSLVKTDNPDPVGVSSTLTYTLNVSNAGPSTATSVSVVDTLPGGVAFVSASGTGWTCGEASGVVTCTRASLAAGAAPPITITVTTPASPGPLSNSAAVSAAETDPVAGNDTDTEGTTVSVVTADLSITKVDSPDPVNAGAALLYRLDIRNDGPDAATSITVTDTLPAGVTVVSISTSGWTCGETSGVVTCTLASLGVGAAPAIDIIVAAPSTGGSIVNTATVTAAESEPTPANNTATTTTTVTPVADLAITKTDSPDPVNVAATLTYTLNVSNAGPSDASSVTVTDTLPAGVTFASASGTGWTCGEAGGVVTCTRGSLAVGAAPAITITVTAPNSGGTINNTASVTSSTADPATADNSDSEPTTVTAADLSLVKSDSPDPVSVSSTLTYTLNVSNAGPSTATSVSVVDTLPGGVTFVSASGTGWTCNQASGVVTCTRASLAVGAAPPITITVTTPASPGPLSNSAAVSAAETDPIPGNNTDTEGTTVTLVTADLSLTKSDSPDPVNAVATLTYTVNVSNAGPDPATSVTVTDTLPSGVTFVSASGTGWTCNQASGTVTCTRASLAVGAAPAITITVTAPAAGGSIANGAAVTAAESDPTPANNADTETTTVTPIADLSITKTDSPDPVNAAATLTYTLNVNNAGPSPASGITVTDTLPAGVTFVSASGTGWICNQAGGTVTCTRATLAVGAAPAITITGTAPSAGGSITNNVTVGATGTDPNAANNSDSANTAVTPVADLSLTKTDSPDPVNAAATLTYTLNVNNAGPSAATSVTVTDTLPAGATFVSASGTGWTCSQATGTVTCTRASLSVGAAPITITVTAPTAGGTLNNSATVGSTVSDPASANNSDTESTVVTPVANLGITMSGSPDPVATGGTLTYTLAVTNGGPSAATSVTVSDTLPLGMTFVSASGTGWTCNQASGTVTCTRPTLPVGAAPSITIMVTAPSTEGNFVNTASVAATGTDPVPANNSASDTVTVTAVIPCSSIQQLIAEVGTLSLPSAEKESLLRMLRTADGQAPTGAVSNLRMFIRKITALERTRKLPTATADELVSCAETIIATLQSSPARRPAAAKTDRPAARNEGKPARTGKR